MMRRFLACAGIVALSAWGGYLGVLVSDQDQPVVVLHAGPLNSPIHPGETLRVEYTVNRIRSCKTNVARMVFDGGSPPTRHVLSELEFPVGLPVGRETYAVPVAVPASATPGYAVYRVMVTYQCNFVHRLYPIAAAARDIPFEIVSR